MSLQHWRDGWCPGHGSSSVIQTCLSQACEVSLDLPYISPAGMKDSTN